MTIEGRKNREREEKCALIIKSAEEIIAKEGLEKLSIRKIAVKIDYSPAIIYHYFRDKEDILEQIMQKTYKRITSAISSVQAKGGDPLENLLEAAKNYIHTALKMPQEYKNILLSESPAILEHTSVLFEGASLKRQAVGIMCSALRELYKDSPKADSIIELMAQTAWSSIFGLTIKLIIEKNIPKQQQENLIEQELKLLKAYITQ